MAKSLIIVESPAKIKTLKQILGSQYLFESSYGHIRDLPESGLGVDIEHDFEPSYEPMVGKREVIERLKKAAKECSTIYLSPDPDREGEAIAWHIAQVLPKTSSIKRVTFNSITREAVTEALKKPRDINMPLVDAQQARRILDRLVGYKISPLLNRRLRRGRTGAVSAGRVQSVALKLVVDREKEIEAFIPKEYWNLNVTLLSENSPKQFLAILFEVDGKRVEREVPHNKRPDEVYLIPTKNEAEQLKSELMKCEFQVAKIERKEKRRNPEAPFITSTLQQEASRHFRFSPSKTMEVAQTLYEGVDLQEKGITGLITYMRTDSIRTSPEGIQAARDYIGMHFAPSYLPDSPRQYEAKKAAQDAHEAIRPVDPFITPDSIQNYLTREQYQLYKLVWNRFIASQMASALYDTVSVDVKAGSRFVMRATGSIVTFLGFLAVYEEKADEESDREEERQLPELKVSEKLQPIDFGATQSFTRPPARFTEASLVKELEKSGIGRPSTYASIMKKIQGREYTIKDKGRLVPTELGKVVTEFLETNFETIMSIGFTAAMEDKLEEVATNHMDWKILLKNFWGEFSPTLDKAEEGAYVPKQETDKICPECGSSVQKIWFKDKYFYGCSNYPDCSWRASQDELDFDKSQYAEDFDWEQLCPLCQGGMKVRFGKYGAFLGCLKYPDCKGIVSIPKRGEEAIAATEVPCLAIGCPGRLRQRRSRYGKLFWSCSEYPQCDVIGDSLEKIEEKYKDRPQTKVEAKKAKTAKTKAASGRKKEKELPGNKKATPKSKPKSKPKGELKSELEHQGKEKAVKKQATTKKPAGAKKQAATEPKKQSSTSKASKSGTRATKVSQE